ncbi:MAG: protein kinase [Lentisphaerae bacterium]|nr:protein kinase [Lentisphaerota bacterium]
MNAPIIPGYEIISQLPQGGMSAVFKARQLSLDRVVVIKMLPSTLNAEGIDIGKFFWAEARLTAQLKHPNIVQIYDFGQTPEGIYYFVMEFISGYSVAEWVRRKKRLSREEALVCARWVAEALSYAWETAGVIHCDIKPDNVIIDGDGTVKVADLGLARSVRLGVDQTQFAADLAVGTPYYISPEQSKGRLELDCRTDIYSLGAMLYHCLTGKLPFEGLPLTEIMDRQITDQIPDLVDLMPQTSMAVACLIEKMMAKDRAQRQNGWPEVIGDIARLRSELPPEGPMPPVDASTMKRSPAREQWLQELALAAQPLPAPEPPPLAPAEPKFYLSTPPWRRRRLEWLAAGIILLTVSIISLVVLNRLGQPSRVPTAPAGPEAASNIADQALAQPTLIDTTAVSYLPERLSAEVTQTSPAAETVTEAVVLAMAKAPTAPDSVKEEARASEEAASQLRLKAAEEERRQFQRVLNDVAARLVEGNPGAARSVVQQATNLTALAAQRAELLTLEGLLAGAEGVNQRILDSFRSQKDQEVVVALTSGPERLVVQNVHGETILAEKRIVVRSGQLGQPKVIRLQDLALKEKMARLGTEATPETALARGLVALRDGDLTAAEASWSQTGPILSGPLMAKLQELKKNKLEGQARADFIQLLRAAQLEMVMKDEHLPGAEALLAAIYQKQYPPRQAQAVAKHVESFQLQYGKSEFARVYAAALAALQQAAGAAAPASEFGAAETMPVPARPPAAPVAQPLRAGDATHSVAGGLAKSPLPDGEAVRRELLARNLGLTEYNVSFTTDDQGRIVRAELISGDLKDIKPLAGLKDLRAVVCAAGQANEWREAPNQAPLSDLSALKGLSLREVSLNYTRVKDLAPLALMPLTRLNLDGSRVTDLTILKSMPLRELTMSGLAIRDLKPLTGVPLEFLNISYTEVADLSPLAGTKLKRLIARASKISDIKALALMPLADLDVSHTKVNDLTPLKGMELEGLNLSQTRVRDLTPLRDLPLQRLNISESDVRDLSPLRGVPLKSLTLTGTAVRDLTPIQNSPIEEIWLDFNPNQYPPANTFWAFRAVLTRMPMLQKVNGNPAFWEKHWRR